MHYRGIEYINDDMTHDRRRATPSIINFAWKDAQPLATSDPPRAFHAMRYKHRNREDMTNEQTVHATLLQTREKRLKHEGM